MSHRKFLRDPLFGILALLAAGFILYLGQRPAGSMPKVRIRVPHADKVAHATMFFAFSWLVIRARRGRNNRESLSTGDVVVVLVASGIIGAVDELWQFHAGRGRSGDVVDWAADLAGAGSALLLIAIRNRAIEAPTTTTSNVQDFLHSPDRTVTGTPPAGSLPPSRH